MEQVIVNAPYHPNFPTGAKRLGGKWNPAEKVWVFDLRDEDRVRELCNQIYGSDAHVIGGKGERAPVELVTLRLRAKSEVSAHTSAVFAAGRCVARATGRDSGARLGDGVVLLEGQATSGGSMKNWYTVVCEGSVLEIRDVPRAAAEKELAESSEWDGEIVEQAQPEHNPLAGFSDEQLLAEIRRRGLAA